MKKAHTTRDLLSEAKKSENLVNFKKYLKKYQDSKIMESLEESTPQRAKTAYGKPKETTIRSSSSNVLKPFKPKIRGAQNPLKKSSASLKKSLIPLDLDLVQVTENLKESKISKPPLARKSSMPIFTMETKKSDEKVNFLKKSTEMSQSLVGETNNSTKKQTRKTLSYYSHREYELRGKRMSNPLSEIVKE